MASSARDGAATSSAARSAVRSLQGEFSRAIQALTDELINLRMLGTARAALASLDVDLDQLRKLEPDAAPVGRHENEAFGVH